MASINNFTLGEQPTWAGTEECVPKEVDFIADLLKEGSTSSLIKRGYAVVELPQDVVTNYCNFHTAFEEFSALPVEQKQIYAKQQFEKSDHSPNQFHGFSVVAGLKEQFMMRVCGEGCSLETPGVTGKHVDLGIVGMRLYEQLDQLCRRTAHEVVRSIDIPTKKVDVLLDPVNKVGGEVKREAEDHFVCCSPYVLPGFVSSSIMDNFHYYNTFNKEKHEDERYYNNHSAHTDSGLLTVVVVTDVPGLEVFDQQLKEWIALEQLLHQYVSKQGKSHRQYATIFWADSVAYLKAHSLQPCMHRVGKSEKERYSVVFKQRTTPLTTACRYQEDYILADLQMKAVDNAKSIVSRPSFWIGATAVGAIVLAALFRVSR